MHCTFCEKYAILFPKPVHDPPATPYNPLRKMWEVATPNPPG